MVFLKCNYHFSRVLRRKAAFPGLFVNIRLNSYNVCQLVDKSIISISGADSYKCLQGLITNDIRCLYSSQVARKPYDCLYSFILYPTGKVLADIFIYDKDKATPIDLSKSEAQPHEISLKHGRLFIECDDKNLEKVLRHLKRHKLRSDVNIDDVEDLSVWSAFPSQISKSIRIDTTSVNVEGSNTFLVDDPRIDNHYRLLGKNTSEIESIFEKLSNSHALEIKKVSQDDYTSYRCGLGIGEGYDDHPSGKCFPLECNGDLLNAISFTKGCYVGQELTARTYHTGVIRKRLTPIKLLDKLPEDLRVLDILDKEIYCSESGKKIGKLRSLYGLSGLGLMYIEKLTSHQPVTGFITKNDHKIFVETSKPSWWPNKDDKS